MTRTSFAAFIASGDDYSFRSPYVRMDHYQTEIVRLLGRLSERTKLQFLVACVRHAWTTHVRYEAGERAEQDALVLLDDLLDAHDWPLPELVNRINAFQQVYDHIKAQAHAGVPDAVPAANVFYVTGGLLSWLYHAIVAIAARPELTWFEYTASTGRWPGFWRVLDGAASVGGAAERAWQAQVMTGFASDAPVEPDVMREPAWGARQFQLGPMFLRLWLVTWAEKRALIEQYPDLTDRTRHLFAKLLVVKAGSAPATESQQQFLAMIDANAILLDWCNAAMTDREAVGGRPLAALDSVFGNAQLRALVEHHSPLRPAS
ncbi:MAG: hypothetical protein ABIY55_23295 [Kofleriaceae bacterium]